MHQFSDQAEDNIYSEPMRNIYSEPMRNTTWATRKAQ